jgi:hypothetical protein
LVGFCWALLGAIISAWMFVFCRMISQTFHYSVPLMFYLQLSCICTPIMAYLVPETKVALLPVYDLEMYLYIVAMFVLFYIHVLLFSASWQYNTVGT